ncbi:MAG: hypothetical protein L3J42_07175, partial [Hydrogenimonas sp.]|nr:hypothetical protein [Hydrogenimonas sp.]
MHIKRYTLASIVLIAAVGGYVYYMITKDTYTVELLGVNVSLPIAVWIVVPMALLYIASLFHMLYYGFKGYLQKRRTERDLAKLSDALYWDILKAPKKHSYDDREIRKIGVVLDSGCEDFFGVDKSECDERVKEALEMVEAINRGEYVDMKKVSLDISNPLVVKNWLNFLKNEPARAEEILRRPESYDKRVVHEALKIFVESASESQLEKYKEMIEIDTLLHLLDTMKDEDKEKPRISLEFLETLLETMDVSEEDYLQIAQRLSKLYTPDEVLRFFEKRVAADENAFKANIFVLIEFEMLDKA